MSTICDDLRAAILQAAIQGKLTKQLPEDGSAEDLLKEIKAEKEKLIAEGKIKKQKPLAPITDKEIPFNIPKNWKWVRLGEIGDWRSGATPPKTKPEYYKDGNIKWLLTGDLNNGLITDTTGRITELALEKTSVRLNPIGSVLIAMYGATIGKLGVLDVEATTNQACCACVPYDGIYNWYLFYFLMQHKAAFISEGAGAAQPNISKEKIIATIMPLPPLAEQKRIVEKVDELMARVADLEQSADALASLKKAFPSDIKASLLQAAMQGKLTKRLSEDGDAENLLEEIKAEKEKLIAEGKIKKQKPLAPITDDEIPFSIPENWRWVRLDEIANSMSAGKDKPKDFKKEKDESHPYPVIANGVTNDGILGYTGKPTAPKNTLTVAGRGTIGFSLFREYEYCPIVRLIVVDLSSRVDPRFVQLVMQAFPEESLGTSIPQLTVPMLRPKLVPLPPLAEQKRIVERLDSLMQNINTVEELILSE